MTAGHSCPMARASSALSVVMLPHPPWTPRWLWLPGETKRRFVPMEANRLSMPRLAPSPMLTMAITAPTPMMIPKAVRNDLILLRARARKATRHVLTPCMRARFIMVKSPWRTFPPGSGPLLPDDEAVLQVDPLPGPGGDVGLVGDHDHGHALLFVEGLEDIHDLRARPAVEVAGGLVGQDQGWVVEEGPGDGHPLLLSARELGCFVMGPGLEPDGGGRGQGAVRHVLAVRRRVEERQRRVPPG